MVWALDLPFTHREYFLQSLAVIPLSFSDPEKACSVRRRWVDADMQPVLVSGATDRGEDDEHEEYASSLDSLREWWKVSACSRSSIIRLDSGKESGGVGGMADDAWHRDLIGLELGRLSGGLGGSPVGLRYGLWNALRGEVEVSPTTELSDSTKVSSSSDNDSLSSASEPEKKKLSLSSIFKSSIPSRPSGLRV